MEILEYLNADGRSPYRDWFDALDAQAAAKVAVALTRIALGNLSNAKGVGAGVQEYRIDYGPRVSDLLRQGWRKAGDPAGRRHQETPAG